MSWSKAVVAGLSLVVVSCSSSSGSTPSPSPFIPGFDPPAAPAGYQRYVTQVFSNIAPGTDQQWCEWLTAASDQDQDVLDVVGAESAYGHHLIMYATAEPKPVGTITECTNQDMLSVRFLGGVGGEAVAKESTASILPPNTAFRLPKGQQLMANIHVINAGNKTISLQGVLDVDFVAPSPARKIGGLFANVGTQFSIPPNADYTLDVKCTAAGDLSFFAFTDHMHWHGASALTEIIHADGSHTMLTDDPSWTPDLMFNPHYVKFASDQPFVVHQGDVIRTHCEWHGDPSKPLTFPDEMCVGTGFYFTNGGEVQCVDGQWAANTQ